MLEWRRRRESSKAMLYLSPLIAIGLNVVIGQAGLLDLAMEEAGRAGADAVQHVGMAAEDAGRAARRIEEDRVEGRGLGPARPSIADAQVHAGEAEERNHRARITPIYLTAAYLFDDFAEAAPEEVVPIATRYRGYEIASSPPPSSSSSRSASCAGSSPGNARTCACPPTAVPCSTRSGFHS